MPLYQELGPVVFKPYTTAERDAAWPDPPIGLVIWNTDEKQAQIYSPGRGISETWYPFAACKTFGWDTLHTSFFIELDDGDQIIYDSTVNQWRFQTGDTDRFTIMSTQTKSYQPLNMGSSKITNVTSLFLDEQAAAQGDVAGDGQIWVNTATPNELWFTDDAGNDVLVAKDDSDTRYLQMVCFDFTTDCATGNGKFYAHIPPAMNGMNLTYCHAEVITAGASGNGAETMDIEIYNLTDTVDMLSTTLTIDATETGSDTAATPYVIDGGNDDVATNDVIRVDVDAVNTTPAKGLIVTLGFRFS